MTRRRRSVRVPADAPTLSWGRGLAAGVWIGLFVTALCVLLVVIGSGPVVTAAVEGSTETIELRTTTDATDATDGLHWRLPGFRMRACGGGAATSMDGLELVVHGGALVRVDRPELGGATVVDVSSIGGTAVNADCAAPLPVDVIAADGSVRKLVGAHAHFTRDDDASRPASTPAVVLPVQARITVGQEVGRGVDRLLLKGTVTMHADQSRAPTTRMFGFLHRKRTYLGETVMLARGDRILPPGDGESKEGDGSHDHAASPAPAPGDRLANGYLRIPPNDAIQFAFIEATDRVIVQRAGNATVEVDLSFWQRLENEPALTGVIAFLVALLAIADLASRALDLKNMLAEEHEHERAGGR